MLCLQQRGLNDLMFHSNTAYAFLKFLSLQNHLLKDSACEQKARLWAHCAAAKLRAFFLPAASLNPYLTLLITPGLRKFI